MFISFHRIFSPATFPHHRMHSRLPFQAGLMTALHSSALSTVVRWCCGAQTKPWHCTLDGEEFCVHGAWCWCHRTGIHDSGEVAVCYERCPFCHSSEFHLAFPSPPLHLTQALLKARPELRGARCLAYSYADGSVIKANAFFRYAPGMHITYSIARVRQILYCMLASWDCRKEKRNI